MPNPHVTSVDRDAFWNQYRSTPEPALMANRPPRIVTPALYRERWPSSGPYAGQSFPPFSYEHGESELTPIQEPFPEWMFPNPPSDMPIHGLGFFDQEVSRFGVFPPWRQCSRPTTAIRSAVEKRLLCGAAEASS